MGGIELTPLLVFLLTCLAVVLILVGANGYGKLVWDWQFRDVRDENARLRKQVGELDAQAEAATQALSLRTLVMVRKALAEGMSEGEVKTLCFDLGVDYKDVPGETPPDKIRELIAMFNRQGRVGEVIAIAQVTRPDLSVWADLAKGGG